MIRLYSVLLLAALVLLPACSPLLVPVTNSGTPPAPINTLSPAGTDNPDLFVDAQPFQKALVEALNARDSQQLRAWMTEPFLTGWWRGERTDDTPAEALNVMLNQYLSTENRLEIVVGADLYNLMGEQSPISIPRLEAGVESAFLVSGWGKDDRDEMVLFIARRPDNSLRWQGAILVPGGFTAQQMGGVKRYNNPAHGYRVYIPRGFEVQQSSASQVVFLAPGAGQRERGFISVEPANGRTVQEVADTARTELPSGQIQETAIMAGIEGSPTLVLDKLPGQNFTRQVFVIRNDVLYRMTFVPSDETAGEAYRQMENLYGTILNTFHFLPANGRISPLPVTDLELFETQLHTALAQRNVSVVRALMGDSFTMAFWQGEAINVAPTEAAGQIVTRYVPPDAALSFDNRKDLSGLFLNGTPPVSVPPSETVLPVFVSGWGLQGKDEAVLYIARRLDGSLYWRGILIAQGVFPAPPAAPQPVGGIPVTAARAAYVLAQKNVKIRSGPGGEFDVLGVLQKGQTAQVTGASENGGWWRVTCPDGTVGNCWVSADPALTSPVTAPGR